MVRVVGRVKGWSGEILSVLLREWGKFLLPPIAEPTCLGASASLMLGVTLTGPSGCGISKVSFQMPESQLIHAQAASGARDAVRITPTFNYSRQPVHTPCHLTSSLSLPRGRGASSSRGLLSIRGAGASALSSPSLKNTS